MTEPKENPSVPPPFDEEVAASYVGKYILVGIAYLDHEGTELRREQIHGVITSATKTGIEISLRGTREGDSWNMPPDLRAISPAAPGKYTLHKTEEVIEDPDLLSTWVVTKPPPEEETQLC